MARPSGKLCKAIPEFIRVSHDRIGRQTDNHAETNFDACALTDSKGRINAHLQQCFVVHMLTVDLFRLVISFIVFAKVLLRAISTVYLSRIGCFGRRTKCRFIHRDTVVIRTSSLLTACFLFMGMLMSSRWVPVMVFLLLKRIHFFGHLLNAFQIADWVRGTARTRPSNIANIWNVARWLATFVFLADRRCSFVQAILILFHWIVMTMMAGHAFQEPCHDSI